MQVTKGIKGICSWLFVFFMALALPVPAQQKAGNLKIKSLVFENARGEKVDAELGVLLVPENRKDPGAGGSRQKTLTEH